MLTTKSKKAKNMQIHAFSGHLLESLRKAKKITQAELSEKSGVSQAAISKFEKGLSIPGYDTLVSFGRALGVFFIADWHGAFSEEEKAS